MEAATGIIGGLVSIGAAVATWLVSKRREVRRQEAEKNALSEAVYKGDKDALNRHLRNALGIVLAAALLSGCASQPKAVYVPLDRAVHPLCDTNGVAGWFVPNATMDDICRKLYDKKFEGAK